jgi:cytochrome c peroxidase
MPATNRAIGTLTFALPITTAGTLLIAGAAFSLADLPAVPVPSENPITEEKRVLGKALFWDEQLSIDNTVSCGSCHMASAGGADARLATHPGADNILNTPDDVIGSPGVIGRDANAEFEPVGVFELDVQVTARSAQTAIMAMYAPELFWDGRAGDAFVDPDTGATLIATGGALETQALGPILNDVEMGHPDRDWEEVANKLSGAVPLTLAQDVPPDMHSALDGAETYADLFERAFGDPEVTPARIAFAIATYERTLVPDQTPWDAFVAGDTDALSAAQQAGWQAFVTSACAACHTPPTFTDDTFRNIAVRRANEDRGRGDITGNPADNGRFKVPTLRNAGLKPTFMHTGDFTNMNQVLAFYRGPGAPGNNRDPLLPVAFPPNVNNQVVDFLVNGLTDPRVAGEEFPFDRPSLHSEHTPGNPLLITQGVAGSGGTPPEMIAVSPPNLGNAGFQVGVSGALGGASAELVLSSHEPSGGELSGEVVAAAVLNGVNTDDGYGTGWWPIPSNEDFDGRTVYLQWRIDDPGAPGGVALSPVARLDLFCGSACPPSCAADLAEPAGTLTFADIGAFVSAFQTASFAADLAEPWGQHTFADIGAFLASFNAGCP